MTLLVFTGISMVEKPKALHVLGLEQSADEVRGAKLSQKRGKPVLDLLFSIPVPQGADGDVKQLYIESSGKSLLDVAKRYLIATTLIPGEVLVRSLEVTLKKAGDIDSVLAFQAEPLLPYPVESAVLDRIILAQSPEGSQLTLLSARKDRVQAMIDHWKTFQVEPEVITCVPAALADFSNLVASTEAPLYVVHISRAQTVCVLVRNGRLIASQTCSKHLGSLEQAFTDDSKVESVEERKAAFTRLRWDDINATEHPVLHDTLEQLKLELTRTLFSLAKQVKGAEIPDVLITGDCGSNYDLVFHLGHALNKHVVTPEVPPTFNAPLPQVLKYAVPIGVALSSLPQGQDAVNFRQGELAYPDPWKRLKMPLVAYFGLCMALSAALYLFGEAYLGYLEDDARADYANLLTVMQKPHPEFEKELHSKNPQAAFELSLKNLSMDQLSERVSKLEKELAATPDIYPLQPNILTVSDVLAWLNMQPTVAVKDPKSGNITPLIQIDSFSYTMVKRPEVTKKNERYQVKVEIEFSTPTPKEAREFHDALIAPNQLVDPKGEVKWSTNRGKYRASFYLKDKTAYPTN